MQVLQATGLSKSYRQYANPFDSLKEVFFRRPFHTAIHALQNINLQLHCGEHLGVIGNNGAGKSTLLKLLAGTLQPTQGSLTVRGRVSAILELGSGFHPEFSGLENIRMGCALLGLSPKEIEQRIPEIIAFSELGEAVHRPVKTYSSGMYVRLAFSVVTAVDPEILIIDEALSVGDQHFQKKSLDRIRQFMAAGKTVVFCSHNLYQVKSLCRQALWLEAGQARMLGPVEAVVDAYTDATRAQDEREPGATAPIGFQPGPAQLLDVSLEGDQDQDGAFINGGRFQINVLAQSHQLEVTKLSLGIVIKRNDDLHVYGISTEVDGCLLTSLGSGRFGKSLVFNSLQLLSGYYLLYIYLLDETGLHIYDMREGVLPFSVRHQTREIGLIRLAHCWEDISS